jgi:hypothetical protein
VMSSSARLNPANEQFAEVGYAKEIG